MGGCYRSECKSEAEIKEDRKRERVRSARAGFEKFAKTGKVELIVESYKNFMQENDSGFIELLATGAGIEDVSDIPKEFNDTEYEVKFDIGIDKKRKEPKLEELLNAFDFPAVRNARFLKDSVNIITEGVNNFYGNEIDERLVVIEKAGSLYLKEKGPVIPLELGVNFEEIVIKRSEKRGKASFEEVSRKVDEIRRENSVDYKGKIRKEKGDAFILDVSDGRIYSFTVTRANLIKPGEKKESDVQRQLELEYAGYIPGFKGFEKNSEQQIVHGMVDLAKYTYILYNNAPVNGCRMNLALTGERKYDFVSRIGRKNLSDSMPLLIGVREKTTANAK